MTMHTKEDRWTQEEVEYLSANYGHVPDKEIAEHTGRTLDAVRMKAAALGMRRKRFKAGDYLSPQYAGMNPKQQAAAMGRSLSVVYEQLKKARRDENKTRN